SSLWVRLHLQTPPACLTDGSGSGSGHQSLKNLPSGPQCLCGLAWPVSTSLKVVNCKPKNQDEQEIPFRLREIMRSRQEMKNRLSNKKRRKEAQVAFRRTLEKEARGTEPDIVVPKFKQRKGESDGAYIQRMEQEAQHVMFLSKNQASRHPEVQEKITSQKTAQIYFQRRRLDKARQKKEARAADRLEQELLCWTRYGLCHLLSLHLSLPSLPQPGQKSLMLRKLLIPSNVSQPLTISLARQRIMQEERDRAVQAYRALKQQQQKQSTLPPKLPSHTQRILGAQP
uniref:Coiled-coil domain containing 137 n=1 Tax=Spermophilus dauricus TaxID=99837 RepID=A0A8C9PZP4_SPEDA